MAFWRSETLCTRLPSLVSPFDPSKVKQAAYTLSVGTEAYITPHGNHTDPERHTKLQLKPNEGFTIPSGQFAFILTREQIEIPDDALGFISIRTPLKFKGLVNISGFHVDAGYKGRLIVSVFNAGPSTVSLAEGEGILKLWYADLDGKTLDLKTGVHNELISSDLISQVPGQLQSLQSLSQEIEILKNKQESIKWTIGIVTAVIVVVFSAALSILTLLGSLNGGNAHQPESQQVSPQQQTNQLSPSTPTDPRRTEKKEPARK